MARINRNKVMETARRAVEKGQVDKAIREYQKVVQEDPKDVRVWLKIGDLFAKKGAKAEATETYTRVARFYSEQGFYLKAVAVYKQILKLDPRLVEVNLKLAELYRQLGLLSDAMQHFEMVAAFFHREGKTREALATLRQLVELDPENVATRIKLAELYSKEGMVDDAVEEFAHACDFLRTHNRLDDFIKVAERLLWHKADNLALNKELATLYLRRGDPRRALQKLQVCFKADARDVDTLALLAQAFQALEQRGKTVSVLKELARILTENGDRARAADVHRKILELVPQDAESRAFLGGPTAPAPAPRPASVPMVAAAPQPVEDDMIVEEPEIAVEEFQARPDVAGSTGSFPLVRQASQSDYGNVTFSPPASYDEATSSPTGSYGAAPSAPADFAADFEIVDESSYESSVRGEANADEIIKVLTETDVYVKYGLHQKAIEHLHKVFDLDPDNIEARERLKDILIGQGRQREAVSQLIHLAAVVAPREPERAEAYLRDALEIEPDSSEAREIATRFHLDLFNEPDVEIIDDAPLDFGAHDSIEFESAPGGDAVGYAAGSPPPAGEYQRHTSYGGYGDSMSYPATSSPPGPSPYPEPPNQSYDFELDLDSSPEVTGQQAAEPYAQSVTGSYTLSEDDIILEDEALGGEDGTMEVSLDQVEEQVSIDQVDDLDFAPPSDPLPPDPLPPDPLPPVTAPPPDPLAPGGDFAGAAPGAFARSHSIPPEPLLAGPAEQTVDVPLEAGDESTHQPPGQRLPIGTSSLEDDLDEADFFIAQGLYDEARDILQALAARYPNHPLITSKLEEVENLVRQGSGEPTHTEPQGVHPDLTVESKPSVMLEKPLDDEDADTHFDLGLAYKEMGLYDEAIKAFSKVISVAGRAVQCYLMLGLCHRERGNVSEAISQFKAGLYVDQISTAEKYGLYYEIGGCYEQLSDPQEALYYYEMIVKKQPDYRDVSERVERLRAERAAAGTGSI